MISNTRWSSKSRALTRIFGSFQDPDSSVQFIQDPESSSLMTMKRLKMMPVMMVRIRNYQVVVDSYATWKMQQLPDMCMYVF
jgi:hypothetical protein